MIGFAVEAVSADSFDPVDVVAALLGPFPVGVNVGLHALGIEVLPFSKIADIELYLPSLVQVVHPKVKPSRMPSRVGIASQEQVVLISLYPDGHVQVSTLEGRVETDLVASCIESHPPTIFPHSFDSLSHRVDRNAIPGSITPEVVVLLIELNRVRIARPEVDELESIVGGKMGGQRVNIGVVVGERERTRGKLWFPAHRDIGLKRVVLRVEYVSGGIFEVISEDG